MRYNLACYLLKIKILYLGGPDRLAASEARARSRGASPSRGGRHQHHIHVHGPINGHVNVGQPSKYCSDCRTIIYDVILLKDWRYFYLHPKMHPYR